MTEPIIFTPYSTATPLLSPAARQAWIPDEEQERIASYLLYEQLYWNSPDTFLLVTRGTDELPVYVPNGRIIVNTLARFTMKGLRVGPSPTLGTPAEQLAALEQLTALLNRERWVSRFQSAKKLALIHGDMVWHVVANPLKPEGSRISLYRIDPGSYFPVEDPWTGRTDRVHIANTFQDGDDTFVRRLTYEKIYDTDGNFMHITSMEAVYEMDEWEGTGAQVVRVISALTELDPVITSIPVYHIRNDEEDGNPFGSSTFRGLERMIASVNQSVSDEDMALALEGLGVYATESGAPVDDEGNTTDWWISPGRVLENVKNFRRVDGVSSVQPWTDHINRLEGSMFRAAEITEASVGRVDASVAESGIALALNMGPTVSKATDSNESWTGVLNQLFYDLNTWYQVYGEGGWGAAQAIVTAADPMPRNRKAEVDEVATLASNDPPLMSLQTALERLQEIGVRLAPDELDRITTEQDATSQRTDPFAARAASGM